jgi:hypothetical protein
MHTLVGDMDLFDNTHRKPSLLPPWRTLCQAWNQEQTVVVAVEVVVGVPMTEAVGVPVLVVVVVEVGVGVIRQTQKYDEPTESTLNSLHDLAFW